MESVSFLTRFFFPVFPGDFIEQYRKDGHLALGRSSTGNFCHYPFVFHGGLETHLLYGSCACQSTQIHNTLHANYTLAMHYLVRSGPMLASMH